MSNSPFEMFRKNLKPMMIVLVFLAMIAFVVLPALQTYMQRNVGTGTDSTLASFDGLELKQSRVDHFTRNHASIVRFLSELAEETIARGGTPRTPGFAYDTQSKQVQSIGIDSNPSQLASVRTLQYSAQATDLGFELDDTAISTWLSRFTDGTLSDGEIIALLMQSTRNQMGKFHLYDQLRHQLLAELYQRAALAGVVDGQLPIVTPVEQWENFLKLNQQANASAYAVMVQDYIDKTNKNPGVAEIRAVYEEGKDLYPYDQSPDPGFRRRETASFEYLVANLQSFVDREVAQISEETLRAEYERRRAGGDFKLPEVAAPETPGETEPAVTEPSTDKPEADKPGSETPATETPATETPAADRAESDEPTADDKPADADESRVTPQDRSIRLVAFQEEDESPKEVEPAEEKPASKDKAKPAQEKPAQEKPADEAPEDEKTTDKPAEKKSKDDKPAEKPADVEPAVEDEPKTDGKPAVEEKPMADKPVEEKPSDSKNDKPAAEEKPEEEKPAETKPVEPPAPKFETFEAVKDRLADEMAGPAAREKLGAAINEATTIMRRYFNEKSIYESDVKIGKAVQPPKRPDFKTLAKSLGLDTKKVGPHDEISISSELIAESFEVGTERFRRGPSFAVMMYGVRNSQNFVPKQQLFSPLQTADDQTGKSYVSWKVAETEAYTPELDEVRDEVIMVIRTREARKLAREAAEAIAKKANEAKDKSLAEFVPADKKEFLHENLGPFTWMDSFGFGRASIGNVPQLDSVGAEFMREVFTNDINEAGVASNQPQRVYYIVRPTGFQPSVDELRRRFLQPQERMMAMLLGNEDAGAIVRGFYKSVDDSMGFEYDAPEQE